MLLQSDLIKPRALYLDLIQHLNRWSRVCDEEAIHDDDSEINDANSQQSKSDGHGSDDVINANQ